VNSSIRLAQSINADRRREAVAWQRAHRQVDPFDGQSLRARLLEAVAGAVRPLAAAHAVRSKASPES
jgi:hypothetical protein